MELSGVAKLHAAGRVAVGAALTLVPGRAGAGWIGPVSGERPTTVFSRALGVRDAALGLGVLYTAGDAPALRPWLVAGFASDVVDAAASLEALKELPRAGRILGPAVAGGSALLGVWMLAKLGRPARQAAAP